VNLDPWFVEHLVCPRDRQRLTAERDELVCGSGHRYPVVDGVPVMLIAEAPPTIEIAPASIAEAQHRAAGNADDRFYLSTLSLNDDERRGIRELANHPGPIDPVVAYLVAATNGLMYRHLIGELTTYPVPELPMPEGGGRRLLDVGCSWGRWTLAASARGYDAVGIDPSLGAVAAARRVASALNRPVHFVVGDARHLPFPDGSFGAVYSYSVLQHFSYDDAARAIGEAGRVLERGGLAKVQMPTRYGVRCLYHQLRRGFREARGFEVRYWTWPQLGRAFGQAIGPARFEVDGFFGIGLQSSDANLMPAKLATVLRASELLKQVSRVVTPLRHVADSVFVEANRTPAAKAGA
jgi:SAM-dependent methyltransferase